MTAPTANTPSVDSQSDRAERAEWLRLLAQADAQALAALATPVLADYRFEWLRPPEQGLMMLRARIGNSGDRFNLGEVTVTRCVARHVADDGSAVAGVGHVMGLATAHAEQVAWLDALLQRPALHGLITQAVLLPLRVAEAQRRQAQQVATATSRVRFFTLQPEAA